MDGGDIAWEEACRGREQLWGRGCRFGFCCVEFQVIDGEVLG